MKSSEASVWGLAMELYPVIRDGGKLHPEYEQRIAHIYEEAKVKLGDEIAERLNKRLMDTVTTYKKTGAWDFVGVVK